MHAQVINFKLVVNDLDRSLAFYAGLFGLKEAVRLEFTNPDVVEVLLEDATGARSLVLLHGDVLPVPSGSPGWAPLVVHVDDIDAARDEITDAVYELAFEPLNLGAMSLFMAVDPDGYLVEVITGDTESWTAFRQVRRSAIRSRRSRPVVTKTARAAAVQDGPLPS